MMCSLLLAAAMVLGAGEERFSSPVATWIRRLDGTVVHCEAQQVLTGIPARQGKWVIRREVPYVPPGDPYGFKWYLDAFRSQHGLWALVYDANLSTWAAQNNAACSQRGLGHWINPGCWQNSGWNYADAYSVFMGWAQSPGHRLAMLAPVRTYGIAYGPGPYWTLNLR